MGANDFYDASFEQQNDTKPQPATGNQHIDPKLNEDLSQNPLDVFKGDSVEQ